MSKKDNKDKSTKSNKMTWKDAIIYVMQNNKSNGECQPMHYRDITDSIIEQQLRDSIGKTPADTVSAQLTTNKDLFESLGNGIYRLIKGKVNSDGGKNTSNSKSTLKTTDKPSSNSTLIKCYGMYWTRDAINWEHSPKLLGVQSDGASPIDLSEMRGVYLLYDGREVIYVGQAAKQPILKRLIEHTKNRLATRWNRFSWFGIDNINEKGCVSKIDDPFSTTIGNLVDALEGILIEGLEPRQNRRQGDNWGFEYYQKVDDAIVKNVLINKLQKLI